MTAMLVKTAVVTVRTAELLTEPNDAVIVAWPGAKPVATPLVLIVATDVEELQVTEVVKFCVLPSLKNPVAVNDCVVPEAIVGFTGATVMVERVAGVTVRTVEPLTESAVAAIVV